MTRFCPTVPSPDMIFLVDPNEKVFIVIVPDSARVWPITRHVGAEEQRGNRLVEQEVVRDVLLLLSLRHRLCNLERESSTYIFVIFAICHI